MMVPSKFYSFFKIRVLGSKIDRPSNFFIKTSNAAEYIELDIQNIEALRIDNPII